LEKDKFEEDTSLSEKEKEYQNEYNKLFGKNQEIESIILHKDKNIKKIKSIKISQKGDKSQKEKDSIQEENSSVKLMRQSQKMLLKNTFNVISSDHQGNTETIDLPSRSFPK
jgi:hypothetical protein